VSKQKDYREFKLPHRHCLICGISIPEGKKFCSRKCMEEYEELKKLEKRNRILAYIAIAWFLMFVVLYIYKMVTGM